MSQPGYGYIKKAPLIGAFLFAGVFPQQLHAECETHQYDDVARLEKVSDGDTLRLKDGRKIRLIAVNTPELGREGQPEQALAREALQELKAMFATSSVVKLKYGSERRDRYKRVLAHVFTEQGKNVAAELIAKGLGFAIVVPPNNWQSDCYFKLEQQAASGQKGLWAHPAYRIKRATDLTRKMTGFQRVEGRVSKVGKGKKWLWLDFSEHFSVKVDRRNLQHFKKWPLEELTGKQVRIRGWVAYYNGKLRMSLRHPMMMEILD